MFIFFPYNTDAPIYYWPYTTVGMIVLNIVAFYLHICYPEQVNTLMLEVGNGLHPVQWLTNNFLHAGVGHLFGNMMPLWTFGLVVEGKLGPWKSLALYLGVGTLYGFIVQVFTLGAEPTFCLGASAIVYAIMVICLIWAPENMIDCFVMGILGFRPIARTFEIHIKYMVLLLLGLQILLLSIQGGALSSEYLHVVGAVLGLIAALGMLKLKWVDCENWDIFSTWSGKHLLTKAELKKIESEKPEAKMRAAERAQRRAEQQRSQKEKIVEEIRWAVQSRNPFPAFVVYRKTRTEFPDWSLPENDLLHLIQSLIDHKFPAEAIFAMKEYLKLYRTKRTIVLLKLAQILKQTGQPASALRTLSQIDETKLAGAEKQFYLKLREKIKDTPKPDTYELSGDF